jgi:hypothetical protein
MREKRGGCSAAIRRRTLDASKLTEVEDLITSATELVSSSTLEQGAGILLRGHTVRGKLERATVPRTMFS